MNKKGEKEKSEENNEYRLTITHKINEFQLCSPKKTGQAVRSVTHFVRENASLSSLS